MTQPEPVSVSVSVPEMGGGGEERQRRREEEGIVFEVEDIPSWDTSSHPTLARARTGVRTGSRTPC
jgi:hypothetical protein